MDKILVKFGPRVKKVEFIFDESSSFKQCLEYSIREAMKADPFMKQHAASGFFLTQYDEKSRQDVEIDESTERWEVDSDQPISLMLYRSTNLEIPVLQSAPSTQQTTLVDNIAPIPSNVSNYLNMLGVSVHEGPNNTSAQTEASKAPAVISPLAQNSTIAQTSRSHETSKDGKSKPSRAAPSSQASSRKKRTKETPPNSDDECGEYMEMVLKRQKENRSILDQIAPPKNAPRLKPATKRRKKGKENIEPRIMPRRAAKERARVIEAGVAESVEEEPTEPLAQEVGNEGGGPLSNKPQKIVQIRTVGNFHKKKNHRRIGNIITKFTPLPEFPKKLKEAFENGIYDTRQMNTFLKAHVENVTKGLSLFKSEYKVLAEQVISRMKSMNLVNAEGYKSKIKKDLSNCLRSARYYSRRKARRQAVRREKQKAALLLTLEGERDNTAEEADELLNEGDEADEVLQKPVVNKGSIKMCMSASTTRIPYIKDHTVEEVLIKYPYLSEADLLIYEYSLRIPLPLDSLQGNFARSILPLSHILNQTLPEDDDEQSKIMLYQSIENFFSGGEQHLPSIQFCNAANRNATPLNNIPVGQAPAIVVANDGSKLLQSVTLIFDGSILTTIRNPTAFECVALLMSGYWVFHIDFPGPYLQHMESIEAILHDRVPEKARSVMRLSKMDEFFRKLLIATNCGT